ncbi:PQQ-dependent sugar dehydrogenase [Sphaerisporangium sp. TRM90804]|uniref:PQQ-dependent sugar dehydrogenase n=1 Tax=Sphaerisporangium sp. TRM90804 TaxID=3031113 RepID=UPI00244A1AD6|nr:PQQ-dependent sugar dehydrogenase [Sphaerisporangium sp. TRM90804]MDH2429539.1 PQQ-dependent sugar dehydrogenase [Sphaerisporangium sp. TRM90804]
MPGKRWAAPVLLALSLPLLAPALTPPAVAASSSSAPAASSSVAGSGARASRAAALPPLEEINTVTTQVASGLRRPVAIAAPDDGTNRLFIVEKRGTVRVYHPTTGLGQTIIDVTASVDESDNERGLLGIALAPDFARSQVLYLAYTALPDGAVTLGRYRMSTGTLEPLLSQEHSQFGNHNGTQIAFGNDGYLYMSIGDGGGAGDPFKSGQRLDTLLGKILRVDVNRKCGTLAYCVPQNNPFVGVANARPEIWMYGGRNPWRFSIDRADGSMWIGDVGQGRWEEINHVKTGRQAGANLGWSCYEGFEVFDQAQCRSGVTYTKPVFTYSPYTGGCAVTGGEVYRGAQYANLVGGTYIATDYCSSDVWALREDGRGGYLKAQIGEMPTQVTAFAHTPAGELYVVNDLPGGLHRVAFERSAPTCRVKVVTQGWGRGMTVDLTITNTGTAPVDGWTLTFTLALGQTVTSDWNTDLTQGSNVVTASNATHNGAIAPGASVTMGYLVSHTGDAALPSMFALNGDTCSIGA